MAERTAPRPAQDCARCEDCPNRQACAEAKVLRVNEKDVSDDTSDR